MNWKVQILNDINQQKCRYMYYIVFYCCPVMMEILKQIASRFVPRGRNDLKLKFL